MADFPPLNSPRRMPLAIPNPGWLQDHRFLGQAVLPGVWALEQLARTVGRAFPEVALTCCTTVRFEKFLTLPPDIEEIDAVVDLAPLSDGLVEAVLLTRHVAPKSGIARMKPHARACFGLTGPADHDWPPEPLPIDSQRAVCEVAAERLYAEMVPFGDAFQNIIAPVRLEAGGARTRVSGGRLADEGASLQLGSPFPLDAAFHAACAWAQRFRGIVAFPVALQQRLIRRPTRFGQGYEADIRFREEQDENLLFDLDLRDHDGRLYEIVRGLGMRDVSGGRLQPPDWIRTGSNEEVTR